MSITFEQYLNSNLAKNSTTLLLHIGMTAQYEITFCAHPIDDNSSSSRSQNYIITLDDEVLPALSPNQKEEIHIAKINRLLEEANLAEKIAILTLAVARYQGESEPHPQAIAKPAHYCSWLVDEAFDSLPYISNHGKIGIASTILKELTKNENGENDKEETPPTTGMTEDIREFSGC